MTVMLLEWVFTSIFLILVVLALRAALGKRMGAGLRYALWAVVLVRLLVPVQLFTSPIAGAWVVTETRTEQNVADWTAPSAPAAPANPVGDSALSLPVNNVTPGNFPAAPQAPAAPTVPDLPEAPDLSSPPGWLENLGWTWLAGSAAVALVLLLSNLRFWWRLRQVRIPLDGADCPLRVFVAVGLPSPCLFGILRPAVYVTPEAAVNPDMLRHVLAHEHTHYKHGDHLWSLLRCGALAAHWWNPLVWLAAILSQRDGELACDEGALKRLGDGERAGYGNTLLALVTAKPQPGDLFRCATTMAGDKKSLKERITRIASAPKRILWAVIIAVLVTALACICAFGQAAEAEEPEPSETVKGDEFTPTYVMDGDRGDVVVIEGLSGYVEWSRGTNGGAFYFAGDLSCFCPKLAEEKSEGGAYWENGERNILNVRFNVDDARIEDGAIGGFGIDFTVDLSSGTVTRREFTSLKGDKFIELTDQEMLDMARLLDKLMTEAEDYYNSQAGEEIEVEIAFAHGGNNPAISYVVPEDVLNAAKADVAAKFQAYAPNGLCAYHGKSFNDQTNQWEPVPLVNPVPFDRARIDKIQGPWSSTVLGMDLEVWRINYEFHTDRPELAEVLLAGGMYLTEDGWLCPTYPSATYLIFFLDEAGGRTFATSILYNMGGPSDTAEESAGFFAEFYPYVGQVLAGMQLVDPEGLTPDLNRNGVPEELRISGSTEKTRLEVWENGKLLYEEEGYFAHAGYNALFLCAMDDGDCLLRYNPYMGQGWCTYSLELFTLSETGEKRTVQEDSLEFDLNFHPMWQESHQFDVNEIMRFMNEVNELLSHSVQLINTDEDLLATFKKNGRLYDDLGWLDMWAPTYVRGERWLPDELWAFQAAMEKQWYVDAPEVSPVDERGTDIQLRYQDKVTRFQCAGWDYNYQCRLGEPLEPQILDLNGDGRDEIVVILVWGHGTGCLIENLYVFDAETLEQYDTDNLNRNILDQIESTGDEDNFYLSAPWMDRVTVPKDVVPYHPVTESGYNPVADALALGEIVMYSVENGTVVCRLGCDASGMTTNYIGYLDITLGFAPREGFRCVGAQYVTVAETLYTPAE